VILLVGDIGVTELVGDVGELELHEVEVVGNTELELELHEFEVDDNTELELELEQTPSSYTLKE
jgi:hypothetical protein